MFRALPLSQEKFQQYGDVIEAQRGEPTTANQGTAKRFNHLTRLINLRSPSPPDNSKYHSAEANVCVFRSVPTVASPFTVRLLERHKFSTQMFIPMTDHPGRYLLIVAEDAGGKPNMETLAAFVATSKQGMNYKPGTWHHPMIALDSTIDFACVVYECNESQVEENEDTEEFFFQEPFNVEYKWGLDGDFNTAFGILALKGFNGVEASLSDTGFPNNAKFCESLNAHGLKWICGLYSGWDDYTGEWCPKTVGDHLQQYEEQLKIALTFQPRPIHFNAHSGSDDFTDEEAIEFFEQALQLEKKLGVSVSHETHRGRILSSPWRALMLAKRFPDLKFTLDLSHWLVVLERKLPLEILEPRVWERCWYHRYGKQEITLTPEYGPVTDYYMPPCLQREHGVWTAATKSDLDNLIHKEKDRQLKAWAIFMENNKT
ncbi:hypothetical protein HDU76_011591 [Blyttiomyces sp. JEL0837]|nr:hypothetical protein HDU76_011591 [Blyttiomyces sp. JEL0837]